MPKQHLGPHDRTNPLIWCAAIICAILAVLVIIGSVMVVIGDLSVQPKVPQVSVTSAQLDTIYFDQASVLTLQVTIVIRAKNDNARSHASFDNTRFELSFRGLKIAHLMSDPFGVNPNSSVDFNYMSQAISIPLNLEQADSVNLSLRRGVMTFELKGLTRARWRVGIVGSVKSWLHFDCQLHLPTNRSSIYPRCTSSKA